MTKEDMMRLTSAYNADILLSHLNYLRQSKTQSVQPASKHAPKSHWTVEYISIWFRWIFTIICMFMTFGPLESKIILSILLIIEFAFHFPPKGIHIFADKMKPG